MNTKEAVAVLKEYASVLKETTMCARSISGAPKFRVNVGKIKTLCDVTMKLGVSMDMMIKWSVINSHAEQASFFNNDSVVIPGESVGWALELIESLP